MSNATTQVAASKPSCPIERVREESLDADAGVVPQGCLVGRNSAGYFVNADDTATLTEVGINTSPSVAVNASLADGTYKVVVERGIVVPMKIATLSTAAGARAQYGKPVYALYNNEVSLSRGTYENFVGYIVGHNSVTEVLVFIPLAAAAAPVLDYSRLTPGAEADGSIMTTGNNWIAFSTANARGMKLLLSYTGTSGDFNTLCMRARSNSAYPVVCGNFSASAGQNNHGNLFAVQGYAQPNAYTQNDASNICCGLYSCIDRTSGGTSVGRDWSTWVDTHMQVKASGGSYLMRLSHNGTVANDGCFTIYNGGRMPYLFTFEDAAGFLSDARDGLSQVEGTLLCKTPAGDRYIQLYST